jgi:hypothetical protein
MGFDTHMILETVPVLPSTRQNAHHVINPTSRNYADALRQGAPAVCLVAIDSHAIPLPSFRPRDGGRNRACSVSAHAVAQTDRLTLNVLPCGGRRCWIESAPHRFSKRSSTCNPGGFDQRLN